MQQFTNLEDIESSKQPLALGALIEHLLSIELSIAKTTTLDLDDGAIYLLDDGDSDYTLINKFGRPFSRILFECVQRNDDANCYVCMFLRNNECCITLIVPDKEWLPDIWRAKIKSEMA